MSPEHTGRTRNGLDARSDLIRSALLYRLATGQLPFARAIRPTSTSGSTPTWPANRCRPIGWRPAAGSAVAADHEAARQAPQPRYQSAAGLEADIRRCRAAWSTARPHRRLRTGPPRPARRTRTAGAAPARDAELRELAEAYAHVALTGQHALVTVSGPSGIGKSALMRAFVDRPAPAARSAARWARPTSSGTRPLRALSRRPSTGWSSTSSASPKSACATGRRASATAWARMRAPP